MADERFTCPKCSSADCWRHEVDVGVGIQYGPWNCAGCGWSEDQDLREIALDEAWDEFGLW
jgi:transcription elongation factor Elf1